MELGEALRIGPKRFGKDLTPLSSVAYGVHSEHILKEQSDAQNVVSRFSTGKHVTGFSGRVAPLRIQFLCHPLGAPPS